MNCRELQDYILELTDISELSDEQKSHLSICTRCRELYETMIEIDNNLSGLTVEPMSISETVQFKEKLGSRIDRLINRVFGFYNFSVRYGVAMASLVLILFISVTPQLPNLLQYSDTTFTEYAENGVDSYSDEDIYDETYIDLMIEDFSNERGFDAGEILIGDIDSTEYNYLVNNINAGDIL
jgi:hypothetical protein